MIDVFMKCFILGIAMAAPVGPVNLLCLRRSMTIGQPMGFATGMGAATADTIYAAIAAFGITWVSDFLIHYQNIFQLLAGAIFLVVGISVLRSHLKPQTDEPRPPSLFNAYASTVAITLTNPATLLAFLAAFGALNLGAETTEHTSAVVATGGVLMGSTVWWYVLSLLSARFQSKLTPKKIEAVNHIAGALLIVFALVLLVRGAGLLN